MTSSSSIGGEESSPSGLNLELGCGSSAHEKVNCCKRKCFGFTISQLQELQLQALIYKYIQAGLLVPYHLLLPIWKSLASSCGDPRFMGCSPPLYLDPKKGTMDAEPWRCRRTDGKKWRCSKQALPDHKYCERHIHRGRHRSRKPVEAASHQHTISSSSSSTAFANTTNGDFPSSSDTNLSISLPMNSSSSSFIFSPKSVLQDHQGTN